MSTWQPKTAKSEKKESLQKKHLKKRLHLKEDSSNERFF